jgi:two-component system, OmpR family, phosphate regulon sensor histidine kinase PhoR
MKKRLIWTSIITVFLSLLALLATSVFLVDYFGKQDTERSLKNYSAIACSYYQEDVSSEAPQNTVNLLKNSYSDVRLTIVDGDGTVIIDTLLETNENHLDRPEIQHPGTIVYRYSHTLKKDMVYLAAISRGDYLRIALPIDQVEDNTYDVAIFGSVGLVLITALSGLVTYFVTGKSLRPLQKEVNDLSEVVGEPRSDKDDVKELGKRIQESKRLLGDRYVALQNEKAKYESLLDGMEQGLVALDSHGIALLVNSAGATTFSTSKEKCIGQDYHFFSTDSKFLLEVGRVLKKGVSSSFDFVSGPKTYLLTLSPLGEGFGEGKGHYGVSILSLDVTERRKLDAAKRDFFANASHELKSPLTSIIGYQELVKNGTLSSEEERNDATERTLKEAERMRDIIFGMLTIAKLESGAPKAVSEVNLKDLIQDTLSSFEQAIGQRNLSVTLSLDSVTLQMDKEDAKNLVSNLVENAIKYNKNGGSLKVSLSPRELVVEDTGIGIAKENQSRIFERFYRVDVARSNSLGGTGLGLAIVKHICLDYGFGIALDSELGRGSAFHILFDKNVGSQTPLNGPDLP